MSHHWISRSLIAGLLLLGTVSLVAAACGDGEDRPGVEVIDEDGSGSASGSASGSGTGTGSATGTGEEAPGEFGLMEPPEGAEQVNIDMHEWEVVPEVKEVAAGDVYIRVKNNGEEPHDFVIARTDLEPSALPLLDGWVREDQLDAVGHLVVWEPNSQASGLFNLSPGTYAMFCNIVEKEASGEIESHYQQGMFAAFTVK